MREDEREEQGVTRRGVFYLSAALVAAVAAPFVVRRALADDAKLVTEIRENQTLVGAIQYVNESPHADRACGSCILFQAGEGGRGRCTLFQQGVVSEKGWCLSWAAKQ